MLVAATSSIWQLFVDTKQDRAIFQKLQIDNPDMIVALDYNPVDKRIYWSDTVDNAIKRMAVTGVGGVDALVWSEDFFSTDRRTFDSPMQLMRELITVIIILIQNIIFMIQCIALVYLVSNSMKNILSTFLPN